MDVGTRVEDALRAALDRAKGDETPPKLAAAVEAAVFPGGNRLRPRLVLSVALACGDPMPAASDAAAVAIEFLHCASLVHDDMPCFDDAAVRRGQPSVHAAFGEPLALLTGDALIVQTFEHLACELSSAPAVLAPLVRLCARSVGMADGLCAGQAWECEGSVELARYHAAKTGALFAASTVAGALAAGARPEPWRALGWRLGEAYQLADDLRDALATEEELGKPVGQDQRHDRPNAVEALGPEGAVQELKRVIGTAVAAVPACPGHRVLRKLIAAQAAAFLPDELAARVA
ncbi:MAG: polyprenyl synthetase family protein [Pseudomonadota bacterium]